MKACFEIRNKLERYIDGELNDRERTAIEAHLSHCADCARELEILKSIDAIGKSEIFPDPPPDYWQQLRQNIMSQTSPVDEKSSRLADILSRLKNTIMPAKVSYRLAGLTATAVIFLFIFYLSFFQKGKYELPAVIDEKELVQMSEQKSTPLQKPAEIALNEKVQEEKNGALITKKMTSSQDKKIDHPFSPGAESESKIETGLMEPSQSNEIVALSKSLGDSADLKNFAAYETNFPAIAETIPVTEKVDRPEITPTVVAARMDQAEMNESPRRKGVPDKMLVKSASLADSGFVHFNRVARQVKSVENLNEKIQVWEAYMTQKPELEFLKRARYQQARLYYQLATEKMTDQAVRQALKFYQENSDLLLSGTAAETVQIQIQELNDLLKKLEEKK